MRYFRRDTQEEASPGAEARSSSEGIDGAGLGSAERRGYDRRIASNGLELSVITVSGAGLDAIRKVLAALRSQTARERIELIVIAREDCSEDSELLAGFGSVQVLDGNQPFARLGDAVALGVRAASAPAVAYAEEHSLPEPRWAAALIQRHRGPWTGVGWSVVNANPGSATSWAHLISDFAAGAVPTLSSERTSPMPWHHVSYKRDELLAYGGRLDGILETESLLQNDLLARGKRLYMEGTARSLHVNVSSVRQNIRMHLIGGRVYAAALAESERLSVPRRAARTLGTPLAPIARLLGLRTTIARTRPLRGRMPGLIASLALCLTAQSAGEALGYVLGEGQAARRRLPFELQRERFLRAGDSVDVPDPEPRVRDPVPA
jgi:hypothetical protein